MVGEAVLSAGAVCSRHRDLLMVDRTIGPERRRGDDVPSLTLEWSCSAQESRLF